MTTHVIQFSMEAVERVSRFKEHILYNEIIIKSLVNIDGILVPIL